MNILGLGGHSKVVIGAAVASGVQIRALFDDDSRKHGSVFCGYKIIGNIGDASSGEGIIAIGNNKTRKEISGKLNNIEWRTVIHPSAIIGEGVFIGAGTVVMAGVVIQTGAKIGRHCILNTGACIDHDCEIGDYSHVAPNCSIAGGVKIETGAFVGIGSSIIQYIKVGKWTTLGAGSVVISDIPSGCLAVGVPAKPVKFHSE